VRCPTKEVLPQLISLVTYGNEFLVDGQTTDPPELFPAHSTFERARSSRFLLVSNPASGPIATGTRDWYVHLKSTGTKRLWFVVSPKEFESHKDATWGWYKGDIPWGIRADRESIHDFWIPEWRSTSVTRGSQTDKRIWDVVYRSVERKDLSSLDDMTTDQAVSQLHDALEEVVKFASKAKLNSWRPVFQHALESGSSTEVEIPDHRDLIPQNACEGKPRQLLALSLLSWVFGGMGWWNDVGPFYNPITNSRYHQVTDRLYAAVLTALVVGANTCVPGQAKNTD